MNASLPSLRWGIVGTGLISSWFVQDLVLTRPDARARHVVQAIGSSSVSKGNEFVKANFHVTEGDKPKPSVYGSYAELYADPDVDIVYIGTPHAFHKRNCLDAIHAGKHVLCEKAFAINAKEAEEVFAAAQKKGVFVMEAMWTRFFPLVRELRKIIHEDKIIGQVHRVFCDFGLDMDLSSLDSSSRLKNPALGAGSLLDIGVYSLTWCLLALESHLDANKNEPRVCAAQSVEDGVDLASSTLLLYPNGQQGVATCTMNIRTSPDFCIIQGTDGHIVVEGPAASTPDAFIVYQKDDANANGVRHVFDKPGRGFYWEADEVAIDIHAGRRENSTMPWSETIRVLSLLDKIRMQGGVIYPQDKSD